jgi:hypothetical protein
MLTTEIATHIIDPERISEFNLKARTDLVILNFEPYRRFSWGFGVVVTPFSPISSRGCGSFFHQ